MSTPWTQHLPRGTDKDEGTWDLGSVHNGGFVENVKIRVGQTKSLLSVHYLREVILF